MKFLSEISVTEIFHWAPSWYVSVTTAPTWPLQQEGSKTVDLKIVGASSANAKVLNFGQSVFTDCGITLVSVWLQLVGISDRCIDCHLLIIILEKSTK